MQTQRMTLKAALAHKRGKLQAIRLTEKKICCLQTFRTTCGISEKSKFQSNMPPFFSYRALALSLSSRREGAFQHFQNPGTFLRPAHQPLPGINEAMNESTMFNVSSLVCMQHSVIDTF